ncbi:MAG: dihydrofolate reductase [Chloroflexi bacterium]|nr:MAG: dihydrofolate reductase [Chloroflexota bacterium]
MSVVCSLTLDGVMQSPGRPDEDTRGGFEYGGWGIPYSDQVMAAEMGKSMAREGSILLGRRTYLDFYSVWPNRKDNPYTEVLNKTQKYVASRTLQEPLPWMNSTLLKGDAADAVAELKERSDGNIAILGSGDLVASLMPRNLIDEYLLLIHPLVLGTGRRLFANGTFATLQLVDSVPTTKGVIIATYRPASA